MANPHDHPTALKELQDSIYREKFLCARKLTPEQHVEGGLEHTNFVMRHMLKRATEQTGITDVREGRAEVRRRMERLCRARDYQFHLFQAPL